MRPGSRAKRIAAASPAGEPRERVVVEDAENLHVLGRFFEAMTLNQLKDPDKVRILDKLELAVAIDPPAHPDSALTVSFSNGRVMLHSGVAPDPDIRLICEAAVLMKLARVPAGPAAVGFLRTHEGRTLIAMMRSGELKIEGVFRHPLGMMGFAKFLAPSAG